MCAVYSATSIGTMQYARMRWLEKHRQYWSVTFLVFCD